MTTWYVTSHVKWIERPGKRIASHRQGGHADGYAQEAGADVFSVGGFARSRVRQIGPSSVTRDVAVGATLPMLITG